MKEERKEKKGKEKKTKEKKRKEESPNESKEKKKSECLLVSWVLNIFVSEVAFLVKKRIQLERMVFINKRMAFQNHVITGSWHTPPHLGASLGSGA